MIGDGGFVGEGTLKDETAIDSSISAVTVTITPESGSAAGGWCTGAGTTTYGGKGEAITISGSVKNSAFTAEITTFATDNPNVDTDREADIYIALGSAPK